MIQKNHVKTQSLVQKDWDVIFHIYGKFIIIIYIIYLYAES